jgi:integrase
MNRRVSVWKYVRLKNGQWRYCKPAVSKNGKIRPDWVIVKGKAEHHPEGSFYLHRYDGGREIWKRVGPSAQNAVDAADFESTYLNAKAKGVPVKNIDTPEISIQAAAHGWLEDVKLSSRPETYELYEHTLREFQEWNKNGGPRRRNLADLTRLDLLTYRKWLITDVGNASRTAGNKLMRIAQWYRDTLKLKPGEGPITVKDTKVGVTEREPEVYTQQELEQFFKACSREQATLFKTFLLTGFREDEVMYLYWSDVDFDRGTLRVTAKPEFDFTVKDYEERTVAVPHDNLMGELYKLEESNRISQMENGEPCRLVFPTAGGKPNFHMLRLCKRIAHRAGLNCKECDTCVKSGGKECEHWFLHKFRATYGTELLRKGYDIATVRKQLGHKPGSEATFRYLAPLQVEVVREKGIDELFENIVDWTLGETSGASQPERGENIAVKSEAAEAVAAESPDVQEHVPEGMSDMWKEILKAFAHTKEPQKNTAVEPETEERQSEDKSPTAADYPKEIVDALRKQVKKHKKST